MVTSQRKDEVEAVYKAAVAAERAAHQQYLLVKDGAQKEDKESARSLVDAARSTVNEVQALLMDARLTAPENGQISTIYPKRGELGGAGTPIMSLVVLDDCHVVLNVREDYMHYFRMNETFRRVPSPLPWPMCNTFAATIAMTAIRAASVPTAGRSLRWRTPTCTWFSRSTSRGRNPAR